MYLKQEEYKKYGPPRDATAVPVKNIPDCNILELDCEGAEIKILENMEIRPETIIVETHRYLYSHKSGVKTLLRGLGYRIVREGIESFYKGIHMITVKPNYK